MEAVTQRLGELESDRELLAAWYTFLRVLSFAGPVGPYSRNCGLGI